jgi:hypothetical protein
MDGILYELNLIRLTLQFALVAGVFLGVWRMLRCRTE